MHILFLKRANQTNLEYFLLIPSIYSQSHQPYIYHLLRELYLYSENKEAKSKEVLLLKNVKPFKTGCIQVKLQH